MMDEQDFYRELGRVPAVPDGIYAAVRTRIRRRTFFLRTVAALAATVILAIGAGGVFMAGSGNNRHLSQELADDLLAVHGYLAGNDLALAQNPYAWYEGEIKE